MEHTVTLQDIVLLAKNRGFIYAGSEIYGGLANAWDYGPYGALMKENIKKVWIDEFVKKRDDMLLIDSAILMNARVWEASGHTQNFSDPLVDDRNTKERFRADKLLEQWIEHQQNEGKDMHAYLEQTYGITNLVPESWEKAVQTQVLKQERICNPNTGIPWDWTEVRSFQLMFRTFQWVVEDSTSLIYLRPETAQGIFVNFSNIVRTSRRKIPFWVAQIGKAFRNEITPWNFIYRTREFEQMEIEFFCKPWTDEERYHTWKETYMSFLVNTLNIQKEHLRFREHTKEELSHYSKGTTDIEYAFPFWWGELLGIANRTDFDLKSHMMHSKEDLSYFDPIEWRKYIPYVIEPSIGLNRLFLVLLLDSYRMEDKWWEKRVYLKLPTAIAPVTVGVLPLVKKLAPEALKIYHILKETFFCEYDEVGSIGKRYARFDEIGTPFCVTVDSQNIKEGNVTVRDRDTMKQDVVSLGNLLAFLKEKIEKGET